MGTRPPFTIYSARRILTMDRTLPTAGAVAVLDGRILGVGDSATLATWGTHRIDDRYAERILMPGLIEGHSHLLEGGIWDYPHVGFYQRRSPDGTLWPALRSVDAVVERLQQAQANLRDPEAPLVAWGFDPILFRGPRMVSGRPRSSFKAAADRGHPLELSRAECKFGDADAGRYHARYRRRWNRAG